MKYKYTLWQLNLETDKREPIAVKYSINAMYQHLQEHHPDAGISLGSFRYHVSNCTHFYFGKWFRRNNTMCYPLSITRIPQPKATEQEKCENPKCKFEAPKDPKSPFGYCTQCCEKVRSVLDKL
ncbi:hypothetical protein C8N40_11172 [Pontibacter mucosus]|uniref:Uncharacterized protein n=1 Tax=Pontibacter mucosus TaxID=1649266 RepID=A0A2T5YCY5_9BACT|nr:hypothetical protein [Pontibacter mucosus]PTX14407.1 hypothetical protein C8N40_11172 [Pontibacter mucosus]